MRRVIAFLCALESAGAFAQDSTKQTSFAFHGFVEVYYSYDFNKPPDNKRPFFLYSHNRHNEFNVNLAYLKGSYTSDRTRANIAIGAGTYMNANYSAEPGVLKNIYEADAGFKLSKTKNLWIDAGILPSHIGFESARSVDCWSLTRSIIAENSPYFEAGARITYTSGNDKWLLSALALNGWQRIQRLAGNSLVSWGTQVQYRPTGKATFNYSSFIGTDKPDSARRWRYFHNLYGIFQLTSMWSVTLGFDLGQEQKAKGSSDLNTWYGTAAILRFTPNSSWAVAVRAEYYSDPHGVIISTGTPHGFGTWGASLNIDKAINGNFIWRTELRLLHSEDAIFVKDPALSNNNTAITTSLAMSF